MHSAKTARWEKMNEHVAGRHVVLRVQSVARLVFAKANCTAGIVLARPYSLYTDTLCVSLLQLCCVHHSVIFRSTKVRSIERCTNRACTRIKKAFAHPACKYYAEEWPAGVQQTSTVAKKTYCDAANPCHWLVQQLTQTATCNIEFVADAALTQRVALN